ncbi:MAG: acetamidase/formamidase family protein [Haloferacaceae archaeon]
MSHRSHARRPRYKRSPDIHEVEATPDTVQWGYFDNSADPVCHVESGDIVKIETITHQAGDAPDYLMDDKTREIYETIDMDDRGPGVHIVTGPVHVEGAEPGDVLECRVLDLKPRLPYGVNLSANWGMLYDDYDEREYVTIYEADRKTGTAKAVFQYEFPGTYDEIGPMVDPDSVDRQPVLEDVRVPLRYHFGTAGVAPAEDGKIDTVPPSTFGGNMDDRRFNIGTSMYYPVHVDGALFTAGDSHMTQGDGEVSGTAIEASLDGIVQLFLRDDVELSRNPVLETSTH